MLARSGALALVLAVVATAPAAAAVRGRVLVNPTSPFVGKRAVIEVRAAVQAQRLSLQLVSPTGVQRHLWLRRVAPGLWRGAYHFADDGQWLLRVRSARIGAGIWVQQPPSPLPPYRPAARSNGNPSLSAILGQGTFVFPHSP